MSFLNYSKLVLVAASMTLLSPACKDLGDEPVEETENPVTAMPASVIVAPGSQASVLISGGTPPYSITRDPDEDVASAAFVDSTESPAELIITAPASSASSDTTSVTVGDASESSGNRLTGSAHGDYEVTIAITIGLAPPPTISYAGDVQPIFTASCANQFCHGGGNPAQGLSLEEGNSYGGLVNVPAESSDCNGEPRVLPFNPAASVLFKRISGTECDEQMPFGGDPLAAADQTTIQTWIDEGALDN